MRLGWVLITVACTGEQVVAVSSDAASESMPPPKGCAGRVGTTAMIDVGTHCIDRTEVTYEQYGVFVAATDKPPQSKSCTWNTNFGSGGMAGNHLPIGNVDWCDADTYCRWAGKRLCGRIGGGALDLTTAADPKQSEWSRACRGGDPGTLYPYGPAFVDKKCKADGGDPTRVGAYVDCAGTASPFNQVIDLSGNAGEWEDACESASETGDCAVRGGWAKQTDPAAFSCAAVHPMPRGASMQHLGFRCCKDR